MGAGGSVSAMAIDEEGEGTELTEEREERTRRETDALLGSTPASR